MSVVIIHRPNAAIRSAIASTIAEKPSSESSCNTELIGQWMNGNGLTDAELKEVMKWIKINCFEVAPE